MDTPILTKEESVTIVREFMDRNDQAAFSTETRFDENRQRYAAANIYAYVSASLSTRT